MPKKKARQQYRAGGGSQMTTWIIAIGGGAVAAIAVIAGVLIFTGGGDDGPPARRSLMSQNPQIISGTSTTIDVVDRDFKPDSIQIPIGSTVTWAFKGDEIHDVTDDRDRFASEKLRKGDTFEWKFDQRGEFYYYCSIHHIMQGTIIVQ